MNILIIHPSFPGQYFYLCQYLAANPENKVVFLAKENSIKTMLPKVNLALYQKPVEIDKKNIHPYLYPATEAVLEGQMTVRAMETLRDKQNFVPDVIIGHAGWGSLMYIKDLFPDIPIMGFFEWYYHALDADSYYFKGEKPDPDAMFRIRSRNMHHLLSLEACDMGITPTQWQYDQFPDRYKPMLHILHEGIDTDFCSPAARRTACDLKEPKLKLPEGTEIISYVSRGFEPVRGFPQFMDAIRIILKNRPKCHVVIAGSDRVCYGAKLMDTSYQAIEEKKGGYDKDRVHFVGNLNRGDYKRLLQSSSCHIYLTRPFVLSWSMLEAMSFGLPLVASSTPPCMEVVEDGVNGLLAEFLSPAHIARRAEELLDDRELAERLGKKARETILERFDLTKACRRYEDLMYSLVRVRDE